MRRARKIASSTLGIAGVIALIAGFLLAYASAALFDKDVFAVRVAASLEDEDVAALAADRVTRAVVSEYRDLTPYRPLILGAARAVVASDPFRGLVRRAARAAHEALMSEETREVLLTLSDVGVVLRSALASQPEVAARIPEDLTALMAGLEDIPRGDYTVRLISFARRLSDWRLVFLLSGLGLMTAGLALSVSRVRTLLEQGLALTSISVAFFVAVRFGGDMLARHIDDPMLGPAAAGVWRAFSRDFIYSVFVLSGIGVVLMAGASSLLRAFHPLEASRAVWRKLAAQPAGAGSGIMRGLLLIGLGMLFVLWPRLMLTVVAFLAGVCLAFTGLREFFEAILEMARSAQPEAERRAARRSPPLREIITVGAVACLLAALGVVYMTRSADSAASPRAVGACNGHHELCERRLDEVVFAGTHNSMGGADIPGWMFANQELGITKQLEDGVRALLIDAHFGAPVGDKVKTLLEDEAAAVAAYEESIGKEGVEAAMRIRDRLIDGAEGPADVYLCHGFCELGALSMVTALAEIRSFLVANPNEVIIMVIRDEGVAPEDISACFERSRLIDFVYKGSARPPWPTLRQMVASDGRVLVMAEHNSEGVAWLHPAFEVMQETPYRFRDPSEFSCAPNRGGSSGSLLLLNHWIETPPHPLPSNAEIVNAFDFLLARARQCQKERGRIPNVIAVDFYRTGGLLEAVDTLNGIPSK